MLRGPSADNAVEETLSCMGFIQASAISDAFVTGASACRLHPAAFDELGREALSPYRVLSCVPIDQRNSADLPDCDRAWLALLAGPLPTEHLAATSRCEPLTAEFPANHAGGWATAGNPI
jgi:hypothetical protein